MKATSSNRWKAAYADYRHVTPWKAVTRSEHTAPIRWGDNWRVTTGDPSSITYPVTVPDSITLPLPGLDVIVDHRNRVVVDVRRDVQAEPKLVIELTADEKDVVIQCRCGDRISLVKLLGLETVKPLFDTISTRLRGLIESLPPQAKP